MKVKRTIHPIGQGAFYTERLEEDDNVFQVVYDCGGNNKKSIVSYMKEIEWFNNKTIDAVFISHLHDDHVNGLEFLLNNCKVRRLFLPQLTQYELIEVVMHNCLANKTETVELLLYLYGDNTWYKQTETHIIKVERQTNDSLESAFIDITNVRNTVYSGDRFHFCKKWVFIPFNPPVKDKTKGFYEYFKSFVGRDYSIEELPNIIRDEIGVKRCREIYKDYFGSNHNAYSMALFSGLMREEVYNYITKHCDSARKRCDYCCGSPRRWRGRFLRTPNCLYMGDFDTNAQIEELTKFYGSLWDTIATLQVPHHGSRNNHDSQLYEFVEDGFISVGENNRYHHPNVDTLIGIKDMGCEPLLVTESHSTMVRYFFWV